MHTMVEARAIARATGVYVGLGNFSSAIGPVAFGYLITALGGRYWGGFLFLAAINAIGAAAYFALHGMAMRASERAAIAEASGVR